MKKILFTIILIVFISLIPIRFQYKDGGTVEYRALLYSVKNVHRINPDQHDDYIEGTVVKVLGFEVYNDVG